MIPLFESFPKLRGKLPYRSLGRLPTNLDVHTGSDIGLNCEQLLVKRDDQSGEAYGGNKVRKLEFLLADALEQGCDGVITFGTAGSNHALATAVYARQCGLQCFSMLTPQPVAHSVRRNLLSGYAIGNQLHGFETYEDSVSAARDMCSDAGEKRQKLCMIRGGGSSPLGCVGFVNAGLELAQQLASEGLEKPDVIYVALGTMGTVTGLMLGLRAAGISSQVIAIRVVAGEVANEARYRRLYRETCDLLTGADSSFPAPVASIERPDVRHNFFGPGYGFLTRESMQAVAIAKNKLGIALEGTYTGKTYAAMMADMQAGLLEGKKVLFWNTYSSALPPLPIDTVDYRDLPPFFHRFFEQPVQSLDT
jgi:D-cysteine desulfhydrase